MTSQIVISRIVIFRQKRRNSVIISKIYSKIFGELKNISYICTVKRNLYHINIMGNQKLFVVTHLFSGETELFTTKTGVADYIGVHRNSINLDKDGVQIISSFVIREVVVNKCKKGFAIR